MNGFADHGLDEAAFGEKKGFTEGLRTFDAFRKLCASPLRGFFSTINSLSMPISSDIPMLIHRTTHSKSTPADEHQQKPNPPTPAAAP